MLGLAASDVALLCVAAYVAVSALVRLMRWRRDELLAKLRSDMDAEKPRQASKANKQKAAQA